MSRARQRPEKINSIHSSGLLISLPSDESADYQKIGANTARSYVIVTVHSVILLSFTYIN